MIKNITLTVEESIIAQARKRAAAEYEVLMAKLDYVEAGRKFTREEMNERR